MKNIETEKCPCCGKLSVTYKYVFNRALAKFLFELYKIGGVVKISDINLSYSQRSNSNKLIYWGLADNAIVNGKKKRGIWEITDFGKSFVECSIGIKKYVLVKDNIKQGFDGEIIMFNDLHEKGYLQHEDYINQIKQGKKIWGKKNGK